MAFSAAFLSIIVLACLALIYTESDQRAGITIINTSITVAIKLALFHQL